MKEYVTPAELTALIRQYQRIQISISFDPREGLSQYFHVTPDWVYERFIPGLCETDRIKVTESNAELIIG